MKTSRYFEEQILKKRTNVTTEICIKIIENPIKEELQIDGRKRYWGLYQNLIK